MGLLVSASLKSSEAAVLLVLVLIIGQVCSAALCSV